MPIVYAPITVSGSTIAAVSGDGYYSVENSTGAPFSVNLPATPAPNQISHIVDGLNNAATHTITINGNGHNIVGYGSNTNSSVNINTNGGSLNPIAWDSVGNQWIIWG